MIFHKIHIFKVSFFKHQILGIFRIKSWVLPQSGEQSERISKLHFNFRRKRSKGPAPDEGAWDCSVCTFKNNPEAFKCAMCDVRKGTSTRKPRLNPDLVAAQQAQALTPPPPPFPIPGMPSSSKLEDPENLEEEEEEPVEPEPELKPPTPTPSSSSAGPSPSPGPKPTPSPKATPGKKPAASKKTEAKKVQNK